MFLCRITKIAINLSVVTLGAHIIYNRSIGPHFTQPFYTDPGTVLFFGILHATSKPQCILICVCIAKYIYMYQVFLHVYIHV